MTAQPLTETEWSELLAMENDPVLREKLALARGYAWGRQDAGSDESDTLGSLRFALAYGRRWRDYRTEVVCYVPNIESSYDQWHATGDVVAPKDQPTLL